MEFINGRKGSWKSKKIGDRVMDTDTNIQYPICNNMRYPIYKLLHYLLSTTLLTILTIHYVSHIFPSWMEKKKSPFISSSS